MYTHDFMKKMRLYLKYILLYLLTPWCRVLLEKLTGLQLVRKFPAFHGTRRFITALTSVRHLSLSWASPIQSIYPHPTSWRSILILSTHLRLDLPRNTCHNRQNIPGRTKTVAEMEWVCESEWSHCLYHEIKNKGLGRYVSRLFGYAHTVRPRGHFLRLKNTVLSSGMWRRIT